MFQSCRSAPRAGRDRAYALRVCASVRRMGPSPEWPAVNPPLGYRTAKGWWPCHACSPGYPASPAARYPAPAGTPVGYPSAQTSPQTGQRWHACRGKAGREHSSHDGRPAGV